MKNFEYYYLDELKDLHEGAQAFAQAFPEHATMLNIQELQDKDPYVERLLEGVAYLTAQVKQQIDLGREQLKTTLIAQIFPQILKPIPALTLLEFTPAINFSAQELELDTELEISSGRSNSLKQPIIFSLAQNEKIYPVHLKEFSKTEDELIFILQTFPKVDFNQLELKSLRFYLYGDTNTVLQLFLELTQHVLNFSIEFSGCNLTGFSSRLIKPGDLIAYNSILPNTGQSWVGLVLLEEYFVFREKFFFIDIGGLDKITWPAESVGELKLILKFKDHDLPNNLSKENFRLHVFPAINLYKTQSEPIHYNQAIQNYRVTVDYQNTETMVYEILDLSFEQNGQRQTIDSFVDVMSPDKKTPNYQVTRQSYTEKSSYFSLQFHCLDQAQAKLSCELIAFNGSLPRQFLNESSLKVLNKHRNFINVKNLFRPTAMLLPRSNLDSDFQLLSQHLIELSKLEQFKALLNICERSQRKANQEKIQGILSLKKSAINLFKQGVVVPAWSWCFELSTEHFSSTADAYHFGYILHLFLLSYTALNESLETRIKLGQQEWLWQE